MKGLLVVLGIIVLAIVLLVMGVVFLAFRKKNKPSDIAAGAANEVLSKGRSSIMEIRRFAMRIKNPQIRSNSDAICSSAEKIIRELKDQPQSVSQVRQFLNYYLPTLASILSKYVRLEESGVPAEDVTQQTQSFLQEISGAMDKLYEGLFDDEKLDLTVEMETLTLACKRDGLIVGEEFVLHDGERDIRLTL